LRDENLLIGSATADDAGVYRIGRDRALVQTVDFFTPIVDDPFTYGQIAAANSLSDVYAMGGRPLTALTIAGMPDDKVPLEVFNVILRGGAAKAKEARCVLLGGHTIRNPEPIYGLSVTGLVNPSRMITNANARPGDALILTKPLGTGIVATGIKRGLASATFTRKAIHSMRRLNCVGPDLAERGLVRAGTDITGFGLLGHLRGLCRESRVGVEIDAGKLPIIGKELWDLIAQECVPGGTRGNLKSAEDVTEFGDGVSEAQKLVLADAQTSGGLLLSVSASQLPRTLDLLRGSRVLCLAVVGRVVSGPPRIIVRP
jgi:selenide,water dikinase